MNVLYGGIDLYADNCMIVVLDCPVQIVFRKRLPNQPETILQALTSFKRSCPGWSWNPLTIGIVWWMG